MKTLLVLGTRPNQLRIIRHAKRRGLRVIAIDPDPTSNPAELADQVYARDLADLDACVAIARRESIDGVLTAGADFPVPAVARICASLGLPGLSERAAILATNKKEMKRAFAAHGVPSPLSYAATCLEAAIGARDEIAGNVVVKPGQSSGGRGITWIGAEASVSELQTAFERAMAFTQSGEVLVEQCVEGREYSVEMLTYDGQCHLIAVTDKITSGKPYFVELGHAQSTHLTATEKDALVAVAVHGAQALAIESSALHAELYWSQNGPCVVEIGARLGGGFIATHLVPLSTGIDMIAAATCLALGETPDLDCLHNLGAAIKFLTPPPGTVSRIAGVDEGRQLPGVIEVELDIAVGDVIRPLLDDTCRIGHVIAQGEDAAAALNIAENSAALIQIDTK